MPAPNTRNWKANEIPDFVGRTYSLVVTGDVEVNATNKTPKLSVHNPQGINPSILLLDLKIVSSGGFGGALMHYKQVIFKKRTSGNQYSEVDILFDGRIIKRIRVGHPKSIARAAKKKRR
jgi:hypothetical protein